MKASKNTSVDRISKVNFVPVKKYFFFFLFALTFVLQVYVVSKIFFC